MRTLVTARAIILDPDGRMLILRRSQTDPLAPGAWDLPGGQAEEGEAPEAVAIRETAEETGITPQKPQLFFATSGMRGGKSKTWLFYVAEIAHETTVSLSFEHDDYKWILPGELAAHTTYHVLLALRKHMENLTMDKET